MADPEGHGQEERCGILDHLLRAQILAVSISVYMFTYHTFSSLYTACVSNIQMLACDIL